MNQTTPSSTVQADDWQRQANCLDADPSLFFPERGGSTKEAKKICKACCVREDCLEYALATPNLNTGIWGGISERERRRIRRQRALARAVQPSTTQDHAVDQSAESFDEP